MFGSGFGFHVAVMVAACSRAAELNNSRTAAQMKKVHGRV
jgi:hypothetical protein